VDKIRELRIERGLSQAKLAARAGVDPSTVNQIERGAREASPTTLRKLAQALGVSLAELIQETDSPKAQRRSSLEPSLFNGDKDERRPSRFAEAIVAAADKCVVTMVAPHTDPKVAAGMVDALTALHETIMAPMQDEQYRQTLTEEEGDEILAVLSKLLEAASAGVRRLEDAAEDEEQEHDARKMRERIREWNRQNQQLSA
jgi:transcriptional regulator with XRE-family HTH domain